MRRILIWLVVAIIFGAPPLASAKDGAAKVWMTTEGQFLSQKEPVELKATKVTGDSIVLEPERSYQKIVGFGGAFTDATCYTLSKMQAGQRAEFLKDLLSADKMGLSLCRTCIGSSDYSKELFSYDEGAPDPEIKRFSIDHDRAYVLPILKEARAINPDLFLFSSPWSPPGWMKANGSMLGGNMRPSSLHPYATYICKFLKAYQEAGVPIQAVTVQNEVDTDQDGRMPACAWPQELEVGFVSLHLGPQMKRDNIDCQIWMIDHNYNLWGRALASLEDKGVQQYARAIAWHGYAGEAEKMTVVHDAHPDVDAYWTEGGPDYTDPNYKSDWVKWSKTFTTNLRNWCRGVTVWNLALDEKGFPNIGPFPCGGLVTVDSTSGKIGYSGQYRALAHYSHFIHRGAVRIATKGEIANLYHVAFKNPDGEIISVLTNAGDARKVALVRNGKAADLELPGNSVTTVAFE